MSIHSDHDGSPTYHSSPLDTEVTARRSPIISRAFYLMDPNFHERTLGIDLALYLSCTPQASKTTPGVSAPF